MLERDGEQRSEDFGGENGDGDVGVREEREEVCVWPGNGE